MSIQKAKVLSALFTGGFQTRFIALDYLISTFWKGMNFVGNGLLLIMSTKYATKMWIKNASFSIFFKLFLAKFEVL